MTIYVSNDILVDPAQSHPKPNQMGFFIVIVYLRGLFPLGYKKNG